MKKKLILILLLILLSSLSLYAKPELWVGSMLTSGRNYLDSNIKESLVNTSYSSVKRFNAIGPSLELVFFPFDNFRIGLVTMGSVNFVIGIDGNSYYSRNLDRFYNIAGGLAYYQMLGDGTWGLGVDAMYFIRYYQFATSNIKNEKDKSNVEYLRFNEQGIFVDLALIARFNRSYFKFGFNFLYPITAKNSTSFPFSADVFAGGGFVF